MMTMMTIMRMNAMIYLQWKRGGKVWPGELVYVSDVTGVKGDSVFFGTNCMYA